jgi:Tfp pilus assembly protein PilP
MKFNRLILPALAVVLLLPGFVRAQETANPPQDQTAKTPPPAMEKKIAPPVFSYNPAGRRDPFKDLFGGQEIKGETPKIVSKISDMEIDDITLMGIVKTGKRYEAIIAFADGFPMTLLVGQKLADGYVLSIDDEKIVFRKTSDRGIPLAKPRDIVKEFKSEEPSHE